MRKCALFLLGLTRWASCRQVQPASSNYATTPTCSRLHLPRAIHACVNVAFSVIGSVLRRFAWNSRHSKLIDIHSEDILSPLGGGCHVKVRRSSCFESLFTTIHWGLINTSGARARRSLASRADVWPLLSLLHLPSPVLQTRTPHREETIRLAEPRLILLER